MEIRDMVRMANQIASFFEPYGEETAVKDIGYHLKSFWEPHMMQQLRDYVARGGEGLSPLVLKAVQKLA